MFCIYSRSRYFFPVLLFISKMLEFMLYWFSLNDLKYICICLRNLEFLCECIFYLLQKRASHAYVADVNASLPQQPQGLRINGDLVFFTFLVYLRIFTGTPYSSYGT